MGLRLELVFALALVCGCYEPTFDRCAVTCATGQGCPSGLSCIDGFCLESGESAADCIAANPDAGANDPDAQMVRPGMALIEGGPFMMGCNASENFCDTDEQPLHQVTLSSFQIDINEVNQTEYNRCVMAQVCAEPEDAPERVGLEWDPVNMPLHPVFHVTWIMASDYCNFVDKRLPTEAEWERAARGPGDERRLFPWGNDPATCELANYDDCPNSDTPLPVGSLPMGATPEGVNDLAGNVFEWVNDWYQTDYYSQTDGATDPQGPVSPNGNNDKANRGGGFDTPTPERFLRASNRNNQPIVADPYTFGFRCAADF